ncbi:DUF5047 domain-containing protein [Lentzea sp. NPDC102401]|uniref:DUF5047 domain-containing protein n=1 Tax=Lentzea sp. NPDC102401 TaxID=3364128 RepID=UPI003818AC18
MRPVSDTLKGIVSSTHTAKTRVRTVTGFPQSTAPAGAGEPLAVVDGFVEMDSSAEVRSTIDLEVRAPYGSLLPDGTELFVEYGVEVSGGSFEWTSLGYFRIDEVTQAGWDGTLRITGSDRMAQVRDTENMFSSQSIPAGTSDQVFYASLLYSNQAQTWMHSSAGVFGTAAVAIVFDYDANSATVGYQQPLGEDTYYEMMKTRAERSGKRLFFDYLGQLNVVSDVVEPNPVADLIVRAGKGGQLSNVSRQITRRGVYTSVRVTGQQATEGDPPWGWSGSGGASVPNPAPNAPSWYGKFGRIVKRFASPLLLDQPACTAAADTLMSKVKGLPSVLSFDMIPHPGLETLDTVVVTWPENTASAGTVPDATTSGQAEEIHVVDRLRFPLAGGPMSVTTRAKYLVVP